MVGVGARQVIREDLEALQRGRVKQHVRPHIDEGIGCLARVGPEARQRDRR